MDSVRTSKLLSLILRHEPGAVGLKLDEHGWVDVDVLLGAMNAHGHSIVREQLDHVVRTSYKKRFAIAGNRIRANQGHSVEVDLELCEANPPAELFHGTSTRFFESILESGLEKADRHHVHLSSDKSTASAVGKRHGKLVVFSVDSGKMAEQGIVFYQSANDVWLVDRVPSEYLQVLDDDA
jgi:putative RNA 2'-phosphotransferase